MSRIAWLCSLLRVSQCWIKVSARLSYHLQVLGKNIHDKLIFIADRIQFLDILFVLNACQEFFSALKGCFQFFTPWLYLSNREPPAHWIPLTLQIYLTSFSATKQRISSALKWLILLGQTAPNILKPTDLGLQLHLQNLFRIALRLVFDSITRGQEFCGEDILECCLPHNWIQNKGRIKTFLDQQSWEIYYQQILLQEIRKERFQDERKMVETSIYKNI